MRVYTVTHRHHSLSAQLMTHKIAPKHSQAQHKHTVHCHCICGPCPLRGGPAARLVAMLAPLQAQLQQGHAHVQAVAGLAEVGSARVGVDLGVDLQPGAGRKAGRGTIRQEHHWEMRQGHHQRRLRPEQRSSVHAAPAIKQGTLPVSPAPTPAWAGHAPHPPAAAGASRWRPASCASGSRR